MQVIHFVLMIVTYMLIVQFISADLMVRTMLEFINEVCFDCF